MKKGFVVLGAIAVAGCTVSPSVNYHLLSQNEYDDSWIPYQLTDTTLVIGVNLGASNTGGEPPSAAANTPPKPRTSTGHQSSSSTPAGQSSASGPSANTGLGANVPAAVAPSGALIQPLSHEELRPVSLTPKVVKCVGTSCMDDTVSMAAVPISFETVTLGIESTRNWFVYTHLAPSYYPNSLRLAALQISVEDKRQEAFDTFGAIAVGSAKAFSAGGAGARALLAPKTQSLQLPVVIDLADAKEAQAAPKPLPNNEGWTYQLKFLDDPSARGFKPRAALQDVHNAVLTSLCRPIAVSLFAPGKATQLVLGVTAADPDYILPIPMPPSGQVTFGTLCGANVTMNSVASVKANEVVTSFFNDVEQIRGASKAAATQARPSAASSSP